MDRNTAGWSSGLLGVMIFSGSLPATRAAVVGFSPLFLTSARAVIAALLGGVLLLAFGRTKPARADIIPLAIVAIGVVIGFPLLTALALRIITAANSVVFVGLLPLSTAMFGVLRGGERPRLTFWVFSTIGAATVAGFALLSAHAGSLTGAMLMVAAILVCGLGYAEGATLARRLGGWQVISWALLIAFPAMAAIAIMTLPMRHNMIGGASWLGLAYVSVFSMLIGFVFWYRGLALGGIAEVGQLQLLQPFMGLGLSALLLGEPISWTMIASALIVLICVVCAKKFA